MRARVEDASVESRHDVVLRHHPINNVHAVAKLTLATREDIRHDYGASEKRWKHGWELTW